MYVYPRSHPPLPSALANHTYAPLDPLPPPLAPPPQAENIRLQELVAQLKAHVHELSSQQGV
jgi:hypothetical protein